MKGVEAHGHVSGRRLASGSDELQGETDDMNHFDESSRLNTLRRRVPGVLPENVALDVLIASPLAAALEVVVHVV